MKIIEQFCFGKRQDQSLNEDKIIITDDFICVIDGTSDEDGLIINGKSSGRFAVDTAEVIIPGIYPHLSFREFIDILSEELLDKIKDEYKLLDIKINDKTDLPSFVLTIYSKYRNEIWRIGDGIYMINNDIFHFEKPLDQITSNARSLFIASEVRLGRTENSFLKNDESRKFIKELINKQHAFENIEHEYGYGVVNGTRIPDCFLEVRKLPEKCHIIIASDGYPTIKNTLKESEDKLSELKNKDPLLYKEYKTTKGFMTDNNSFDDRSYISFYNYK